MREAIYDREQAIQKLNELDIARLLQLEMDLKAFKKHAPDDLEDLSKNPKKTSDPIPRILTRREINALLNLIKLTKTKYFILRQNDSIPPVECYERQVSQGDLIAEFIDIFYSKALFDDLFPDEIPAQEQRVRPTLGLIKLITSSKSVEGYYADLCYALSVRFGMKKFPKAAELSKRRLIAEGLGIGLTIGNSIALGFLLAGGFIILTTSFAFLSLAFTPTIIVASLFMIAGMVAGYRMGIRSLPDILAKILGKDKLFDTLFRDDTGKELSQRQIAFLFVGCGFALSTGILTAAFGYSSGLLFMGMLATLPVIGAISSIFPPLAIALLIISASSIFFMMYQSFHELIQIEHPWQELKKYFKELLDTDAARHRVLNKTPFRVYLEFVLTMIIMPLAIGGMVATALSFIPGLAHLSLKALPRTPMAIADVVSSFVGLIAMFGETPFTLRTITTSVAEMSQSIVRFFQDFKIQERFQYLLQISKQEIKQLEKKIELLREEVLHKSPSNIIAIVKSRLTAEVDEDEVITHTETIKNAKFETEVPVKNKLSAIDTLKLISSYTISIIGFLFRIVYALAQGAIAFQGANVGGMSASVAGAACAIGNAYAEATTLEGADINALTRTDHSMEAIESFYGDINRIDRKELEYQKEAFIKSSKEGVEDEYESSNQVIFQPLFLRSEKDVNLFKRSQRVTLNQFFKDDESQYRKSKNALNVQAVKDYNGEEITSHTPTL